MRSHPVGSASSSTQVLRLAIVWMALSLVVAAPVCRAETARLALPCPAAAGGRSAAVGECDTDLQVTSFWVDLAWAGTRAESCTVTLELSVRLSRHPDDWLAITARVPEGYRLANHEPGEWVPFYLMTHGAAADVEMCLQPTASAPRTVNFPVLLQVGPWRQWLTVYLRGTAEGYACAAALTDAAGGTLWFHRPDTPSSTELPGSVWSLPTNVGEALVFVSQTLDVEIETPGYLRAWCGIGTTPATLGDLLSQVCFHAGCAARRVEERRYVVSFAESYRGAPDASWFVLREGHRLRYHAEDAPAAALLPALVEAAGETIGDSPDLVWPRVSHSSQGSFRTVLASACENAVPRLIWELREGALHFRLAARPGSSAE